MIRRVTILATLVAATLSPFVPADEIAVRALTDDEQQAVA